MTVEEKDLLIKDLCSRLPYGVKCKDTNINVTGTLSQIGLHYDMCTLDKDDGESESCYLLNCKPYLFPLESMTEEQEKELYDKLVELELKAINDEISHIEAVEFEVDFYNKHHLDWRGLIPMGLAIDATNLNIY